MIDVPAIFRRRTIPLLWAFGLVVTGLDCVAQAFLGPHRQVDYSLQDTYYVVGHAQYAMLVLGFLAAFGVFFYSFEKLFRIQYNDWLAGVHFGLTFVGLSLILLPQHLLTISSMPLRYVDYSDSLSQLNGLSSLGYILVLFSVVAFVATLIEAFILRRNLSRPPASHF